MRERLVTDVFIYEVARMTIDYKAVVGKYAEGGKHILYSTSQCI